MLPSEQEVLRELVATFSARRIRGPEEAACHLCRRQRDDLIEDEEGLFWCPEGQRDYCNAIAVAHLKNWNRYR